MEKVSTARIALKWGLILALINIVLNVVVYTMGLYHLLNFNFLILLIICSAAIFLALREFRETNGNLMTFGQGFGLGMLLSVTASVVVGLFDLVYKQFIDTTISAKQIGFIEEQYEASGMPPEAIEKALEFVTPWMSGPLSLFAIVLTYLFIGLVCSLIVSAIMKKTPPVFE